MAAFCPKCSYKLSMVDVKPECPVCGVNLVYYGMEETLKQEADRAEFEHACMQPRFDRLKAATIGSPLAIVRLVLSLLPLVATLLPMGKVIVNLPYYAETISVNLVTIITKVFMNLDVDQLFGVLGSNVAGTAYIFYLVAILGLAIALVVAIVNIVNLLFSCGKKGIKRNITTAVVGIVFTVIAQIGMIAWVSMMNGAVPEIFSATVNPLAAIGIVIAFVAEIVVNVVYKKKNIQVKYKDLTEFLLPYDEREKYREEKKAAEKA